MEFLAFIHSAIAYEDPTLAPQLRKVESFLPKLPTPVAMGLAGVAIASAVLLGGGEAQAQAYRPGDRGANVEKIQQALGLAVDGVYGAQTQAAIRNFQQRRGLTVDGIAGQETLQALGLDYLNNVGGFDEVEFGQDIPIVPVPRAPAPVRQYDFSQPQSVSQVGTRSRQTAVIRTSSGVGVNVRDRPNGLEVGGIDDGTRVTLTGRQEFAGGFWWAELSGGGWVATDFLVFDGGSGPGPGPGPGPIARGRFVVAVPGDDFNLLRQVQRCAPGAFVDNRSRLGPFVNAGSFENRSAAERVTRSLRDCGLDARVSYRGVR